MNRDALVATLIGFGIGLILTALLLFGPGIAAALPKINLPNFPKITLPSLPKFPAKSTPSPTPQPLSENFTVDSPIADSIEPTDSILVSGSSPTGSVVVIEAMTEEIVLSPNGDGKYAGTVSLVEGRNDLVVTSYADGKTTTKTVTVYYTPEEF